VFLAHNFKGYDSYPILEWLISKGHKPQCIYQGAKIITMVNQSITFKDSLCFIPMALRQFPKTFDFEETKGYFPHFFNTLENATYRGRYPALEYYGVEDLNPKDRTSLTTWWNSQGEKTFDFQKELVDYCVQDVVVMMKGCLKFRQLYVEQFSVDPFHECLTIASTCMAVFKTNFLKEHSLGVVPPLGYRQHDIQSIEAMEWLWSISFDVPNLQWCGSPEGEAMICGAKVDGYCHSSRVVYQYHGCYWHGCDICFKMDRFLRHAHIGKTMNDLHFSTMLRTAQLSRAGYKVIEMWGHDWDSVREEWKPFPDWIAAQQPIFPREALMGGRTNAVKLYSYCKSEVDIIYPMYLLLADPVDRIRYADVVSLYPHVMWCKEYPMGHPTIFLEPIELGCAEERILSGDWFGIVRCDVDPPDDLFFPILPVIINHKLMFTLCEACAHAEQQTECKHTDYERRLKHHVWTTPELRKAILHGYHVHKAHEVWHYRERSSGVFKDYIRENLKLKLQASGWPPHCRTDEDKARFVKEVFDKQGITLDPDKIEKNPGLRSVAKLNLNSLWGKFGQNPFRSKVEYVDSAERLYQLLYDPNILVIKILILSERLLQVRYEERKESVRPNPNGNVVIASFVTSWARLELYGQLDNLKDRVLYHDTDSIIYETSK
jgi:hypothetical protein